MNRIIRRYDAGNYIFHKNCKTTLVWSLGTTMSDCCIVVWYDSLKNAIIIEKKSESNSLLFLFVVSIRLLLWSAGRAGASCWRMCQISYGFHCHVKLWNKKKILYKKLEQLFFPSGNMGAHRHSASIQRGPPFLFPQRLFVQNQICKPSFQ